MAKKNSQSAVMKKVLLHVRPYWVGLIASLLLALVHVAMTLYIPILVGDAIDCIIDAGRVDFAAMAGYLRGVLVCALIAAVSQWVMNAIF